MTDNQRKALEQLHAFTSHEVDTLKTINLTTRENSEPAFLADTLGLLADTLGLLTNTLWWHMRYTVQVLDEILEANDE